MDERCTASFDNTKSQKRRIPCLLETGEIPELFDVYAECTQTSSGFTPFLFATSYTFSKTCQDRLQHRRHATVRGLVVCKKQGAVMNLFIWLPLGFVLGPASLALCLAFVDACDRI